MTWVNGIKQTGISSISMDTKYSPHKVLTDLTDPLWNFGTWKYLFREFRCRLAQIPLLGFGKINRFEQTPWSLSSRGNGMTTPWDTRWLRAFCKSDCPWIIFGRFKRENSEGWSFELYFENTDWTHRSGTCRAVNCNRHLRSEGTPLLERGLWGRLGGLCGPSPMLKGMAEGLEVEVWVVHCFEVESGTKEGDFGTFHCGRIFPPVTSLKCLTKEMSFLQRAYVWGVFFTGSYSCPGFWLQDQERLNHHNLLILFVDKWGMSF